MSEPTPGLTVTAESEAAGVQSVFGRAGPAIVAVPGDYDATEIPMQRGAALRVKDAVDALSATTSEVSARQTQLSTLVSQLSTASQVLKRSLGALPRYRVVYAVDEEHVALASAFERTHAGRICGITSAAVEDPEQEVELIRAGEVENSAWSFVVGAPVFVGADGVLTQTFDGAWAYLRAIGEAISPTRVLLDWRPPVFLATGAMTVLRRDDDGSFVEESAVAAGAGEVDAGRLITLNEAGKVDPTLLPPVVLPFTHTQAIAADTWVVAHNMGKTVPALTVLDEDGDTVYAKVRYDSANHLTLLFSEPLSGTVICN